MQESAWYAVFVKSGQEKNVKERLDYRFSQEPKIFVPQKEILERKEGKWYRHIHVLFPGYIFMKGEITPAVLTGLQKVPGLYKLLCVDRAPMEIPEHEIAVFMELLDDNNTIRMSDGFFEGGKVKITSGPLLTMHGEILKVDRRKSRAKVKLVFLGEERIVDLGLNILMNDEENA